KCQGTGQVRPFSTGPALSFYTPVAFRGAEPTVQGGFFGGLLEDGSAELPLIPADGHFRLLVEQSRERSSIERLRLVLDPAGESVPPKGLVPLRATAVASREVVSPGEELPVRAVVRSLLSSEVMRVRILVEERTTRAEKHASRLLYDGDLAPLAAIPLEWVSAIPPDADAWSAVQLERHANRAIARYDVWEEHLPELSALRLLVDLFIDGQFRRVLEVPVESRGLNPQSLSEAVRSVALVPRTEVRFEHRLIPMALAKLGSEVRGKVELKLHFAHGDGGEARPLRLRLTAEGGSKWIQDQVFENVSNLKSLMASFELPASDRLQNEEFRVEARWL
ncbi:MAG TPA: hypothetical protein PKA37_18850, partial [Planctomycetota bacterium]|nr:hypothetical protein [Planctomycetota bacterium]